MTERDAGLDLLKGLGCVSMVIGHSGALGGASAYTTVLLFLVGLNTILFFGVSAVTTEFQLSRYSPRSLLLCYGLLFVMGFSWSALVHPDLYRFLTVEIFQIIALGVVLVGLIHRAAGERSLGVHAATALLLLLLNWFCQWRFPDFHGAGILLPHESYVPPQAMPEAPSAVLPGFPLLCWLYVFPLACALHAVSARINLAVAALAASALVLLEAAGFETRWYDKWTMSPGYACLEIATLGLGLAAVKSLRGWRPGPRNLVVYFGRYSLRFLYLHVFGLGAVLATQWAGPYVAWAVGIGVTYWAMRGFERLPEWRRLESIGAWCVLCGICLALPLLMRLSESWAPAVLLGELALGLLFARNFELLVRRVKSRDPARSRALAGSIA